MKSFIGVDPGKKGAYCLLIPEKKEISFIDGSVNQKDIFYSLQKIQKNTSIQSVCVEDVHSLYGMSAGSNFVFGRNVEIPNTILTILDIPFHLVQPKVWQKYIGIIEKGKDIKPAVLQKCMEFYPDSVSLLHGKRGGLLDGRSDSLMIAHYAFKHSITGLNES